jgi:hypothetical protein
MTKWVLTIECGVMDWIHVGQGREEWKVLMPEQPVYSELSGTLEQWYSTFFVHVPPDIISLQLCTPKVVGV